MSPVLFDLPLLPHPERPHPAGVNLRVQGRASGKHVLLRYVLQAPSLNALRWPEPQTPGPADGLWQHTCFEAFVGTPDNEAYQEFNLSPSGQWAHYRFARERQRDRDAECNTAVVAPAMTCTRPTAERFCLEATLDTRDWPQHPDGWTLGLSAVLETTDGQISHWALLHPRPEPDFHHPAARAWRWMPPTL